jgi:hypothetical protein
MKAEKTSKAAKTGKKTGKQKVSKSAIMETRNQREAAAGEIQYGHTIGRHGTDEEKNLNPEE